MSIASNRTSYSGLVTVRTITKGVVNELLYHNNGTRTFMDRLARIVKGDSAVDIRPSFIDAVYKDLKTNEDISILIEPVITKGHCYGAAADDTLDPYEARSAMLCNAVITLGDIDQNKLTAFRSSSGSKLVLQLLAKDKAVLASIESADVYSTFDSISNITDAVLEWRLNFNSVADNDNFQEVSE